MAFLRSVLFTALLFISILPWSLAVLLVSPLGHATRYRVARTWARSMVWLGERLCGLRYRVEGLEHVPSRASVVLLKHSSAYETIVQQLIFPRQCWVLKRELMWAPFFGWALAVLQPIAIARGTGRQAVEQLITQGTKRLADGLWVMVFPEGTRMPAGESRRYGLGGVLLAQRAGCVLVPVAHDAGYFWPRRGMHKRAGTVTFRIGPPVDPAGREPREVNAEIQAWVERQIAEIRGLPAPPPARR